MIENKYLSSKEISFSNVIPWSLVQNNLIGEFYGFKSGHALNNQLLKKIESENAYKIIEIDEIKDAPINYLKPVSEELA